MSSVARSLTLLGITLLAATSCQTPESSREPVALNYVGSSTVAFFIRDADRELAEFNFSIETGPESDGGERAILAGTADLAGIAREPGPTIARNGVAAVMVGRDALAVIVNAGLDVKGLTRQELRRIYAGEVTDWSAVGGPAVPITTFIVGEQSATRTVFREQVMEGAAYGRSETVEPDAELVGRVAATPGGIGFISFAFLGSGEDRVRALELNGRAPSLYDYEYPIARPLYLLWRPGTPGADRFVQWATSPAGQAVVRHHYPGVGILGSVDPLDVERTGPHELGTLVVYTHTLEVRDGDVEYYPHRPYQIIEENGRSIERIRNHRGVNDENPMHVSLAPGVYLIRTKDEQGRQLEFYATIRAGLTTELRVDEMVQ